MTADIDRLVRLLRRRPMTAKQVAEALGCCKPTAYARLRALEREYAVFRIAAVEQGRPGPRSFAYGIR